MRPSPEYFIVRPSSTGREETIVPLIAIDQLPDWIQLTGAPRELDVEQAIGLKSLGIVERESDGVYMVRLRSDKIRDILEGAEHEGDAALSSPPATDKEPSADGADSCVSAAQNGAKGKGKARRNSLAGRPAKDMVETKEDDSSGSSTVEPCEKPTKAHGQKHKNKPSSKEGRASPRAASPMLKASRHNVPNTDTNGTSTATAQACKVNNANLRPHMTEERRIADKERLLGGAPHRRRHPETVYCRHWCHHGTCKWGVRCRYQHRMPATPEGLREVGLKDFPTWYLLFMRVTNGGETTTGYHSGAGAGFRPGLEGSLKAHVDDVNSSRNNNNNNNSNNNNSFFHSLGAGRLLHHPADVLLGLSSRTQVPSHHPSPVDLGLVQDRISALLAGSTAMSNRRQLRQIKEMRELLLHTIPTTTVSSSNDSDDTSALSLLGGADRALHPASPLGDVGGGYRDPPRQGRANLHTNASLAANAARLAKDAERAMNAAVVIPAAVRRGRGGSVGGLEDLEGRLSPVRSQSRGVDEEASRNRERNLVDLA